MHSPESAGIAAAHRTALLQVAGQSIDCGLAQGAALEPAVEDYPLQLQAVRATFVTLKAAGALRGCIGSPNPIRPLVADVAINAHGAAFRDPRFAPLVVPERDGLAISISVLSEREEMTFVSEEDLLRQVRPGVDGLLMEMDHNRGTLLPSVWAAVPEAAVFLRQLKRKAGVAEDFWSERLRVFRYTAESF